jgi:hypothetical protein
VTTTRKRLARRRADALQRPSVDLSDRVSSAVMSQGPRPTCLPCALAAAHEAEHRSGGFQAAVEPVWWDLHSAGRAGPDGALLSDAADSVARVGHCLATLWPYNATLSYLTEDPPAAAGAPPWSLASVTIFEPAHDGVEDDVEDALAAGHPLIAIIEVTSAFMSPQPPDGIVPVPPIRTASGGYHAVLIVGAWTDPVRGRVLLVRNSWGEYWGAGGYCLLPVDYLKNYCVQLARLESVHV